MSDYLKSAAESYNGPNACGWKFGKEGDEVCGNVALWMPVIIGVAKDFEENDSTRVPVALLSIGTCEACKVQAEGDIVQEVVPSMLAQINFRFQGCGLVPLVFSRIEWSRIAEIN